MPKILLTEDQRRKNKVKGIRDFIRGELKDNHITQERVAEAMGITQQAFSMKLKNMSFDVEELLIVLGFLESTIAIVEGKP